MKKQQNKTSKTPKRKKVTKALRVFRIVKNIFFGVLITVMVGLLVFTLAARMNGETPTVFGHTLYRVSSGSMEPALKVGDIILCKECDPMTLKNGDIITYNGTTGELAGKRVTHRVVKEPYLNEADGGYYLVTKGDDNPAEDKPISTSQVTGIFKTKLEFVKWIFDIFVTPWGLLLLIGFIVLAFFNEIINFVRALAGYDEDEKHEDIQDIIERVQRESAEKEKSCSSEKEEVETSAFADNANADGQSESVASSEAPKESEKSVTDE